LVIKVTATAPPSGKDPSVVISGKSRIRKVIKIPNPKMAQIKPCETIELIIVSPFDNSSLIVSQIWRRTYRKLSSIPFSCFIKKPKGCAFWFLIVRFFLRIKRKS